MQIKTMMRYYHTLIGIAKIKSVIIPNAGEDVENLALSHIAGGIQSGTATAENFWIVS